MHSLNFVLSLSIALSLFASARALSMLQSKSIWYPETTTSFPSIQDSAEYDVAVVGGGIFGVNTAYQLKQRGKKVVLLEARTIASGTTGFSTAKLTAQQGLVYSSIVSSRNKDVAKLYYDMNTRGIDIAEELVRKHNIDCQFERKRHFAWTSQQDLMEKIDQEYQTCRDLNIDCKLLKKEELAKELPTSLNAQYAIAFENQAQFDSHSYCVGLAKQIPGDGCDVFENSRILEVGLTSPHVLKLENDIKVRAKEVVVATHLPITDRSLHFSILEGSRSMCVSAKVKPERAIPGMSVNVGQPMRSLRMYKDNVVVSGEDYPNGDVSETQVKYGNLRSFLKEHFDVTDDDITYEWSAMDYYAQDHVPFIGHLHIGTNTLFTGTGYSKWGIAISTAGAELIADMITKKSNPFIQAVDATRVDFEVTGKGFVQTTGRSAQKLIGDKIQNLQSSMDASTLELNKGGLFKKDGDIVGMFKDSDKKVYAVKPVCPHLGCDLVFNEGDKKWDCPCHGSRFEVDGELIHGPAVNNLERIDV